LNYSLKNIREPDKHATHTLTTHSDSDCQR
jgi:hypothetical protein